MTDNPICVCGHHRSDHDNIGPNPLCNTGMWITAGSGWLDECDCPGFEANQKADDE